MPFTFSIIQHFSNSQQKTWSAGRLNACIMNGAAEMCRSDLSWSLSKTLGAMQHGPTSGELCWSGGVRTDPGRERGLQWPPGEWAPGEGSVPVSWEHFWLPTVPHHRHQPAHTPASSQCSPSSKLVSDPSLKKLEKTGQSITGNF